MQKVRPTNGGGMNRLLKWVLATILQELKTKLKTEFREEIRQSYLTAQTETSTAIAVVKQELRESISDVERASIIAAERHLTAVRTLQDEQRQVLSEIITLRVEMKQTLIDNEAKSKAVLLDGLTEWLEKLKPSLIG